MFPSFNEGGGGEFCPVLRGVGAKSFQPVIFPFLDFPFENMF